MRAGRERVSAIAESLLDDIASFMREPANGNIKVDIEERLSHDLVREVRDGNASLGVCWDRIDFEGLARVVYRGDRLVLAVYAGHALAGRASVRFEETLDFEHVGLPPTTAVHTMLQHAAAQAGRTVSYRVIVSGLDAALRVVAANLGVSVVPLEIGRRAAVGADIALVPIADAWAERRNARARSTARSPRGRPINCMPIGNPVALKPTGTLIAGSPAKVA